MAIPRFELGVASKRIQGPARQFTGLVLEGTPRLRAVLRRLVADAPKAMARALFTEANLIMGEAKKQTPVDSGNLRASGHVQPPVETPGKVSVTLGFGGPAGGGGANTADVGYAVLVHEDLQAKHKVGNAKYLERPMLAAAKGLEGRLAKRMRKELGL